MAEFSLVVAGTCSCRYHADMDQWELTHGVKALEDSNSSTADSSKLLLNHPPESLSQDISGGMESLLAICWEFDRQEEWETWARLEVLLGCPYRRDLWRLLSCGRQIVSKTEKLGQANFHQQLEYNPTLFRRVQKN